MTLDSQLLEILRCPACLGTFAEASPDGPDGSADAGAPDELSCTGCGNVYPVRNGVPVLLVDEARRPEGDDAAAG
jgi:uncharacterized protein YbaR (Trm112 family)